jgi:hypothetical protein
MRRLLSFACVLGIAAASAANLPAKTERADVRGVCNVKGIDVYFWPQGHPAIPAIGFPAFGPPHVEFYKPHDVANAGALGYMDGTNMQISANNCSAVTDSAMAFVAGATPQTTGETQKLRCTLAANADLRIAPWTKVTRRVVTRIIKVKGKKKKVRRTIKRTVRVGSVGSVGVSGAAGAVAEVRVSSVAGTSSSLKWDTRVCTPVDAAG